MDKSKRLSRADWIRAAVDCLAAQGVTAVKVEVLARHLSVSKGSFYWHFKNRSELLAEVLNQWETETDWLIEQANLVEKPIERLTRIFSLTAELAAKTGGYSMDTAIFRWAQQDETIAIRVNQVEQKRINYVQGLLQAHGLPTATARAHTQLMYFAFLGYIDRANRDHSYRQPEQLLSFSRQLINLVTVGSNKKE